LLEKKNINPSTAYRSYCEDGNVMKKQEDIYLSLQLGKDSTSGEIVLNIQFDQTAPNFFVNKNSISWCPTNEELDFINEAFGMFAKHRHQRQDSLEDSDLKDNNSEEFVREADETDILDRVLEKKRPAYAQR